MFRGINSISLDDKGRMSMPARYRENLSEDAENQMIITIDTEARCLLLYPLPEWEIIEHKLEALPSFNAAARRIQRLLIGHATEVSLDSQGRILLPAVLREYAQLEKNIMLVGQGKKFEIWSETLWNSERQLWLECPVDDISALPLNLQSLSL